MPRPKVVWSNMVNVSGVYSPKPIRCVWKPNEFSAGGAYWGEGGDYEAGEMGSHVSRHWPQCTTFSSRKRNEVEVWTIGARAAMLLIRSISHD